MNTRNIETLLRIMARLRDPDDGCPWDVKQDFHSIAPYTIEEAYEVADAIERADMEDLREELGDLLLQVVFHARIASESMLFSFEDVVEDICVKMIRRHPHVFGDEKKLSASEVQNNWETIKARERAEKKPAPGSILDAVPANMPGMTQAVKLQKKAAKAGFDWPDTGPVLEKIVEEARELAEAAGNNDPEKLEAEFGDLLFVIANLGRHLDLDPETALRRVNSKFRGRFSYIERQVAIRGKKLEEATLEEMDMLWDEAKTLES